MSKIRHFHQFLSIFPCLQGIICKYYYIFGSESGFCHSFYGLFGDINLIGKKVGFNKLIAWPISFVSMMNIYFLFVLDTDSQEQDVRQLLKAYQL